MSCIIGTLHYTAALQQGQAKLSRDFDQGFQFQFSFSTLTSQYV